MKQIPAGFSETRRTAEFTAATIPAGLMRSHTTKAGTWAKIQVIEGILRYRILGPVAEDLLLQPGEPGIVEPGVPHEVQALGPVRFHVAFFQRPPAGPSGSAAPES